MGIPVEASSAPEMRLVNRLGIVGRTGHSYEVGWMGDDHPGQDRGDIREGLLYLMANSWRARGGRSQS